MIFQLHLASRKCSKYHTKVFSQFDRVFKIKSADNRILQEQLQLKNSENAEMQDTILSLRKQLNLLLDKTSTISQQFSDSEIDCYRDVLGKSDLPLEVTNLNAIFSQADSKHGSSDSIIISQILTQAAEIENLKQENVRLVEEKDGLEIQSRKLSEESLYAKELAAAAAVELRNLAEEVTKLTYENAELTDDLASAKLACTKSDFCQMSPSYDCQQNISNGVQQDGQFRKLQNEVLIEELQKDLNAKFQREAALEAALCAKDEIEADLRRMLDETKCHNQDLENELTNMQVLVAKMRKSVVNVEDKSTFHVPNDIKNGLKKGLAPSKGYSHRKHYKEDETLTNVEEMIALEELKASYQRERRRCKELEGLISRLKGEDIAGLDVIALEELQNLHIEAITKICQAKYSNQNF